MFFKIVWNVIKFQLNDNLDKSFYNIILPNPFTTFAFVNTHSQKHLQNSFTRKQL